MRKRNNAAFILSGIDSFMDTLMNVVGVLIMLVVIAGIKAQSSPPPIDESLSETHTTALAKLDEGYGVLVEKTKAAATTRSKVEELGEQTATIREQIHAQAEQYARLFDLMTSVRAGIDLEAEKKDQTLKEALELKRQILEQDAKLEKLDNTKNWMLAHRPGATVLENMPTPISRTVDDKEIQFRLKGGRIAYVPFTELFDKLKAEVSENKNRLFKQKSSSGMIGPLDGFSVQYLLVTYDVAVRDAYGAGVGSRLELDFMEFIPQSDLLGEPLREAIASPNSEFVNRVKRYRQDIYTITVWVYPDSFEEYRELKKFLYAKGYQVAARPLEFEQPICSSPRGTKSAAQ